MIIKEINGDIVQLFLSGEDIAHGCNCFATMGAGVAGQLAKAHPPVAKIDYSYSRTVENAKDMLGDYSLATHPSGGLCYNLYTQCLPGKDLRYGALVECFDTLNTHRSARKNPLYIPRIGAGIAGGDWEKIKRLINAVTPDIDIIVVNFAQPVEVYSGPTLEFEDEAALSTLL